MISMLFYLYPVPVGLLFFTIFYSLYSIKQYHSYSKKQPNKTFDCFTFLLIVSPFGKILSKHLYKNPYFVMPPYKTFLLKAEKFPSATNINKYAEALTPKNRISPGEKYIITQTATKEHSINNECSGRSITRNNACLI